jgi:uroporphyrin-III C-methyltransferase
MDELPITLPAFAPGSVWLVGAGPGDPALLTLAAYQALRVADIVVHDALVDARILALAHPAAKLEPAGKRGGRPSPKQPDISRRLIELARQGHRVLRLKGGDPFVFGRGGEEALALVAAGVTFRVVPGITAGIAGLAYAGIPLTHRDINQAVTFVTGHDGSGQVPDRLDWAALAAGSPVLVFYMALRQLPLIVERLTAHGRAPEEPAALISQATTPTQRVLVTNLARAVNDVEAAGLQPPAIMVVGDVVRLRAGLDWLGAAAGVMLNPDPLDR